MPGLFKKYIKAIGYIWRNRADFEPQVVSNAAFHLAPAKLQIEAAPVPSSLKWTAATILGLLAFSLLWAAISEIEVIVHAEGKSIPATQGIPIGALESGSISSVQVENGQEVRAGDVLFEMDMRHADLELERISGAENDAKEHIKGIDAAIACVDQHMQEAATSCGDSKVNRGTFVGGLYRAKVVEFESKIRQRQTELASLQSALGYETARLDYLRDLLSSRDATSAQVFEIEQICRERKKAIAAIDRDLEIIQATYRKEMLDTRTQYSKSIDSLMSEREKVVYSKSKARILSPEDGTIYELGATKANQSVMAGQVLARLVPAGDVDVVEAYMSPKDIAHVKVGQIARVKFDSIDFTRHGATTGLVTYVAPDGMSDDRKGLFLLVKVRMDTNSLNNMKTLFPIRAGMTARVEFVTGKRSVLDYLLSPVKRVTSEAFHEQ